jgi:pimeloyl-ACP methyl ester carboxylesterase
MSDVPDASAVQLAPEHPAVTTSDGVRLDCALLRGGTDRDTAVVVANGFTGTWRNPATRAIAAALLPVGDVLTFDFRGHHGSGGLCTVGDAEVHDVEAAVAHLRGRGYTRIATVGFSLGAAVVIRHAGMFGGVAAVAAVSGPSRWYYRGTRRMRLLHFGIEQRIGRWFLRTARKVRVVDRQWDPVPPDPTEMAARVAPAPLLVVHGDADPYLPLDHPRRLHEAARDPKELWIVPGMGHAERAVRPDLARRLAAWLAAAAATGPAAG